MTCYAFFDTNLFEEYTSADQVDWPAILAVQDVTVVIAPVVIRELNRHKDTSDRRRLRDRAARALKQIDTWLATNPSAPIRRGVTVFATQEPLIDFADFNLSRHDDDDHLIASVIAMGQERRDRIVLVTEDIGLRLKAGFQGVEIVRPPIDKRLPAELDPIDQEVRELRQKIQAYEHARPKLHLAFAGGNAFTDFTLSAPVAFIPEKVEQHLAMLRAKHPKIPPPNHDPRMRQVIGSFDLYDSKDVEKYNRDLDRYYLKWHQYVRDMEDHENWPRRTIQLSIVLSNTGSAVADGVRVFLRFPAGLAVAGDEDRPPKPEVPKPPQRPATILEGRHHNFTLPDMPMVAPYFKRQPDTHAARGNILGPRVTRGSHDEIRFDIERITHGLPETLPTLDVTFPSFADAASFEIGCEIHAAQLLEKQGHVLNVKIQKHAGLPQSA